MTQIKKQQDEVKFEQAKWLKEKGFEGIQIDYGLNQMLNYSKPPEQWRVVEWAFQKYKYSIEAEMNIPESGENNGCYVFNGMIKGSEDYKLKIFYKSKEFSTREKALSDAISHFLTII